MKFPVVPTANPKQLTDAPESVDSPIAMSDLCSLIWCALIGLFRPRAALEAENLVLRHQLNVLRRKAPKRVALSSIDRLLLVGLYRLAPRGAGRPEDYQAGDTDALAPCRLPSVLAGASSRFSSRRTRAYRLPLLQAASAS
jgi:hypothetical protein